MRNSSRWSDRGRQRGALRKGDIGHHTATVDPAIGVKVASSPFAQDHGLSKRFAPSPPRALACRRCENGVSALPGGRDGVDAEGARRRLAEPVANH